MSMSRRCCARLAREDAVDLLPTKGNDPINTAGLSTKANALRSASAKPRTCGRPGCCLLPSSRPAARD